ncbi:MAG TPA: chemotaxis protein CheX [Spirochaetia bacterium]|nr:chemotaxis protein CheX [Spirochaetia bacterium]
MDILKPLSCRLELRMPRSLYAGIVELLGSGDADAADEPEDAVLEMVNVLAGSFISERFGPGADMKLELPCYLYGADQASGVPIAGVGCDAEGEPFSVLLTSVRYRY